MAAAGVGAGVSGGIAGGVSSSIATRTLAQQERINAYNVMAQAEAARLNRQASQSTINQIPTYLLILAVAGLAGVAIWAFRPLPPSVSE